MTSGADFITQKRKTARKVTEGDSNTDDLDFKPAKQVAMSTTFRTTRSMTKGPACRETLETAELLEHIIFHLPALAILTCAQRVSKLWKDVIDTSPLLQKKLWLREHSARVSTSTSISGNGIRAPSGRHLSVSINLTSGKPVYAGSYQINMIFSDPLRQLLRRKDILLPAHYATLYCLPSINVVRMHFTRHRPSPKTSEHPTWLGMQLTQPAISTVQIEVTTMEYNKGPRGRRGYGEYTQRSIQATVRDGGGVTFGLVRDVADRMMAHSTSELDALSFSVRISFAADEIAFSP